MPSDAPREAEPLPDDWQERDAIDSYYDAMRTIGETVKAGQRELPAMFRPSLRVLRERGAAR